MNGSIATLLAVAVSGAAFESRVRGRRREPRCASELDQSEIATTSRAIAALEARIAQLEATGPGRAGNSGPPTPERRQPTRRRPRIASDATVFNPAMSAILGGSYAYLSEDPADYRIAGFLPAGDEDRARRAQLQPGRIRGHAVRERRSRTSRAA